MISIRTKLLIYAAIPLILCIFAISFFSNQQAKELSLNEMRTLEKSLIDTRKAALQSHISLAITSIESTYNDPTLTTTKAQDRAKEILGSLSYGDDGYFFVYDYNGKNIVHPRQNFRIGKNWASLQDSDGTFVIQDLIARAKEGGGYTRYVWEKPSTGKKTGKIAYSAGLDRWKWMIGTGLYIDDIEAQALQLETEVNSNVTDSLTLVSLLTFLSLCVIFASSVFVILRERRNTDVQLKELNKRVIEAQEEERGRVARELHDGINSELLSVRYGLELARHFLSTNSEDTLATIEKCESRLSSATSEVRRISHDLRPAALDDLGLGSALKVLAEDFENRTSIKVRSRLQLVRKALKNDAKTALYRVAQEATTNIERHSNATEVHVSLSVYQDNVVLKISDNGDGITSGKTSDSRSGIGLRNMRERIAYYDGSLSIQTSDKGTVVIALLPSEAAKIVSDCNCDQFIQDVDAA